MDRTILGRSNFRLCFGKPTLHMIDIKVIKSAGLNQNIIERLAGLTLNSLRPKHEKEVNFGITEELNSVDK